jgi:cytochrome c553
MESLMRKVTPHPPRIVLLFSILLCSVMMSEALSASSPNPYQEARHLTADLANGKRIFEYCAQCHQLNAWGEPQEGVPQLAGQHADVIIKQLQDIQYGNRVVTPMIPYARDDLLGGAQGIADVAAYVASLPMTPNPNKGDGMSLGRAGAVYKTRCARLCHGQNGEGDARTRKPRIQGQHYEYLLHQLILIRDGRRKNANKAMARRLQGLSDVDLKGLADYVSRLEPNAARVAR